MDQTTHKAMPELKAEVFDGLTPVTVEAILDNPMSNEKHVIGFDQRAKHFKMFSPANLSEKPEFYIAIHDNGTTVAEPALFQRASQEYLDQIAVIIKVTQQDGAYLTEILHNRPIVEHKDLNELMATTTQEETK